MRRINTDEATILRLFDGFASGEGLSLQDARSHETFIARVSATLAQLRSNPIAIHGLRVQSMFAYVAGAMGECSAIMEEDAGLFLADSVDLRRPDFRIVTKTGAQFLVEVKSHSPDKPLAPFRLKASYLAKLEAYARRCGQSLKIAVYWRHVEGMWTLVDAKFLDQDKDGYLLMFPEALKRNEMSTLGDCMIGTVPPLALRLYTDPEKPRRIGPDGLANLTIERVAICAAGKEIEEPVERDLAWFFMMHGRWVETGAPAEVKDGELIFFDIQFAPEMDDHPEQEFTSVGWLSQMISRQYRSLTAADGAVTLLTPKRAPGDLGVLIPKDYNGKVLHLWRFSLQPGYDDVLRAAQPEAGELDRSGPAAEVNETE